MNKYKWQANRNRVKGRMPKLCEESQLNWKRLKTSIFWYKLPADLAYIYRKQALKGTPQYGKLLMALGIDKGEIVALAPYKIRLTLFLKENDEITSLNTTGVTQKGCLNTIIHRIYERQKKAFAAGDRVAA